MLLTEEVKGRFSLYLADLILAFLRNLKDGGLLEEITEISKSPGTVKYEVVRESIRKGIAEGVNSRELLAVFEEVDRECRG